MYYATDKRLDELGSCGHDLTPREHYLEGFLKSISGGWDDMADLDNLQRAIESLQDLVDQTYRQAKRMYDRSDEEALTLALVAMMITNAGQDEKHPICPWTKENFISKVLKVKPTVTMPEMLSYWEKINIWDAEVLPEIMDYPMSEGNRHHMFARNE